MRVIVALALLLFSVRHVFAADFALQDLKTQHGIEFSFLQSDAQSTVAVSVAFKYGLGSDPLDSPAIGALACGFIVKGAGGRTSSELFESFQDFGGNLQVTPTPDNVVVELSAPGKGILGAAQLSNLILTKPDYPAKNFPLWREELAKRIEEADRYPEVQVQRAFTNAASEPHPYFNAIMPTADSVRRVDYASLKPWVARHFALDGIVVSVVGDMNAAEASAIVDALLAGLPAATDLQPSPKVTLKARPTVPTLIAAGTGDQAILMMGSVWTRPLKVEDGLALDILSRIYGDGQKARVFKDIREATGATYGLQYSWNSNAEFGMHFISGRIAKAESDKTVALVKSSWDRFRASGPTASEIADAKASLAQNFSVMTRSHTWFANYVRDQMTSGDSIALIAKIPSLAEKIDVTQKLYLDQFFSENPIVVIAQ
jgi:zinc protease